MTEIIYSRFVSDFAGGYDRHTGISTERYDILLDALYAAITEAEWSGEPDVMPPVSEKQILVDGIVRFDDDQIETVMDEVLLMSDTEREAYLRQVIDSG